ncbi:E3 ubiquitin-protein ligase DTX3L [Bombina bombina]|uniref:E3 ubiquitin-protein ligase DTX3L n=1 Tax=Bombina bombina TaxID=8345 RepID=UPI00235B2A69|nr:E3 ubiquitin-protein ligase DTX3L [Bombina bombina]
MASASARNKKEYVIRVTTSDSCQYDLSKKLVIYFQSSKSGGGECNVTKENGFYIVSFRYRLDWERVLNKEDHYLVDKNLRLIVTKYNPIPDENRNHEAQLESKRKVTSEEEKFQDAKDKCKTEEIIGSTNTERTQSMNYSIKNTEFTGQPEICQDVTKNLQFGSKNKVTSASEEKRDETTKDDKNSGDIVKTEIGRTKANEYSMRIAESENLTNKIFLKVSATLNLDLLSKEQREVIKENFPQLKINSDSSNLIQEVTGTFNDIEKMYKRIEQFVQHKEFSYDEKNPPQQEQNTLCVPSALYEYFNDVYSETIKKLNNQFNVKMNASKNSHDANTSIHFLSLSDNANIAKAHQLFTDTIQSITSDWRQEIVFLPEKRHSSSERLKQIVREHFNKIHVIVEGNKVTLRGPSSQLTGAKKFLEEGKAFRQALKISSFGMKTEVTVNVEHLGILGKLKSRKMKEIEEKYTVKMEQKPADSNSVKVSFRTLNDSFNLEVHACQAFLIVLQDTITNIIRKQIPLDPKMKEKCIPLFEENLKLEGIEIIFQYNEGSVFLIGSPGDVWAAEKKLKILKGALQTAGAVGDEEPMDTIDSSSNKNNESKEDTCTICMDRMKNKKILDKCKHAFCTECINKAMTYKPVCPVCNVKYGVITGNQPDGTMDVTVIKTSLPGYSCDTFLITYSIKSGTYGDNHPNKGQRYQGTTRVAYLPKDTEGIEILKLLKKAFDQKLIFTVGESRTTGAKNVVTWNDIHHKTNMTGGTANFGYPDPDYLKRVRDELKAKGIE